MSDNYIVRAISNQIEEAHKYFPVVLITGARRVGKSTLCRHLFADYNLVNLEDMSKRLGALEDPSVFLSRLGTRSIIDEVQNVPELFSQIQANVDKDKNLKYILTGSCDFRLMRESCQSMAGRVAVFTLPPLSFSELGEANLDIPTDMLAVRGAYPSVWADGMPPKLFYDNYFTTYLERDVRDFLKIGNLLRYDKFMRLMAGRVGSEFNSRAIATEVGVSHPTIAEWLSMLAGSHLIFALTPYFANINKRLTKQPKYYFHDTGLVCWLLNIHTADQLQNHPLRGAIIENMVISEMMRNEINSGQHSTLFFYRENSGREVDLLKDTPGGIELYEIKSAMTFRPEFMKNMDYVAKLLPEVKSRTVIYDGPEVGNAINFRSL